MKVAINSIIQQCIKKLHQDKNYSKFLIRKVNQMPAKKTKKVKKDLKQDQKQDQKLNEIINY